MDQENSRVMVIDVLTIAKSAMETMIVMTELMRNSVVSSIF